MDPVLKVKNKNKGIVINLSSNPSQLCSDQILSNLWCRRGSWMANTIWFQKGRLGRSLDWSNDRTRHPNKDAFLSKNKPFSWYPCSRAQEPPRIKLHVNAQTVPIIVCLFSQNLAPPNRLPWFQAISLKKRWIRIISMLYSKARSRLPRKGNIFNLQNRQRWKWKTLCGARICIISFLGWWT